MNEPFLPSASIETLQQRAKIFAQVRQFFDQRDFFEVQTPVLSQDTVVDRYIEPIPVTLEIAGSSRPYWLQTSPEFAMKRLLAAGAQAIYQLGPAFRAGEIGAKHNIEFTMLEWYRVGDTYEQGRQLLDDFSQVILQQPAAKQRTYQQLFQEHADFDPFDHRECQQAKTQWERLATQTFADHDDFLNWVLAERIEPALRNCDATIIYDWPGTQAALAKTRETDFGEVAERFELYVQGMELANGYHELTSPDELLARNRRVNQQRRADGREALPEESRLLDAMRAGLPGACGVALGMDRLVMMLTGKASFSEVNAFDTTRA